MRSTLREYQVTDEEFVSPEEHEGLHNRDSYIELVREADGTVSSFTEWLDSTKTHKIKETFIYRNDNIVTHSVTNIYEYHHGEDMVATVTGTVTRASHFTDVVTNERDIDMEGLRWT